MSNEDDPVPLSHRRRLKSLDEFQRPTLFPRFQLPTREGPGLSHVILALAGVLIGSALGLILLS